MQVTAIQVRKAIKNNKTTLKKNDSGLNNFRLIWTLTLEMHNYMNLENKQELLQAYLISLWKICRSLK